MTQMNAETMYALLHEIKRVAVTASLSGALDKGTRVLVETYNRCLDVLEQHGDTFVKSLLPTLDPETASVDEVGTAAALLSRYVKPGEGSRRDDDEDDDEEDEDDDEDDD